MDKFEALPIPSRKDGVNQRLILHSVARGDVNADHTEAAAGNDTEFSSSLIFRCRSVIVANLERFPAESFNMCDEAEWEEIIRLRHRKTAPKQGSGGLDGTGRAVPALSEKFLYEVEHCVPHLAESNVVDELVWRDCVQYQFRLGGLTRPRALEYPWPLLIKHILNAGTVLLDRTIPTESPEVREATKTLQTLPMNVALLKATSIGKKVKKAAKIRNTDQGLKQLLKSWMNVAACSGVKTKGANAGRLNNTNSLKDYEQNDLLLAEKCQSWRQLFAALKNREEERRSSQGKRMREKREKMATNRPRVVKVRPTLAKHSRMLNSRGGKVSPVCAKNSKISQLRKEASLQVSRRAISPTMTSAPAGTNSVGGFGAAVAFASANSKSTKLRSAGSSRHKKIPDKKLVGAPKKGIKTVGLTAKWKAGRH